MWSEAKCAGIALAAVLWDDRSLSAVKHSLCEPARKGARAHLSALEAAHDPDGKRRRMRSLVAGVRGELTAIERLPPRARALLARHVPREQGRRLISEVGEARADFAASRALVETLLHQARILPPAGRAQDAASNPER